MTIHHLDEAGLERVLGTVRQELAHQLAVDFAYVFGSILEPLGFHDIDVAIWTSPEAGPLLDVELAAGLTARIGLPVDVRRITEAPLTFLFSVLRGRLLVVRDEARLADLIERTARVYHDLAPLRRRATREAFAA